MGLVDCEAARSLRPLSLIPRNVPNGEIQGLRPVGVAVAEDRLEEGLQWGTIGTIDEGLSRWVDPRPGSSVAIDQRDLRIQPIPGETMVESRYPGIASVRSTQAISSVKRIGRCAQADRWGGRRSRSSDAGIPSSGPDRQSDRSALGYGRNRRVIQAPLSRTVVGL